jgi:hypothetical protein
VPIKKKSGGKPLPNLRDSHAGGFGTLKADKLFPVEGRQNYFSCLRMNVAIFQASMAFHGIDAIV